MPAGVHRAPALAGTWGKAVPISGLARLNTGRFASVIAVSCAAPGDCSAGGYYTATGSEQAFSQQGFVVTERNGKWGHAIEVPGLAKLNNDGGNAEVASVSCAAAGDCSAGGYYATFAGLQAFVVTERNSVWGRAIEVPGTAKLNVGGDALVDSVSCAAPGDCAAGGQYGVNGTSLFNSQAFVVTESNGRWGTAIEVPGMGKLNAGEQAHVESVSCAAPGDCSAGGDYTDGHRDIQALVVTERDGRWGQAIEVPGSGRLNVYGNAAIVSVSCAAAGRCSAGGQYAYGTSAQDYRQAFVVTER